MSFLKLVKKIKPSYWGLRLGEIKHRFNYRKNNKLMIESILRFKNSKNKKPLVQIKREIGLCWKFWKCYPLHYYRENLYLADRDLSDKELLNYIPEYFFYNVFLPFYNSDKYKVLLEDKIVNEQFFRSVGIAQPYTICKIIDNKLYSICLEDKTFKELEHELSEKKYKKIFLKPSNGRGGYGTYVFHKKEDGRYATKESHILDEDFIQKIGSQNDYLMQAGIEQRTEISKIYPHSVNTLRVVVENKKGHVRILSVDLNCGRGFSEVDNPTQGGISISIDSNTGEMGEFAFSEAGERFDKHPETGFIFKGEKIRDWNNIREFIFSAAEKLPQFTYLGWDIALGENGPLAVEANIGFGIDPQSMEGGLREIFGIDDPEYYWLNRGR